MVTCTACGHPNSGIAAFCARCGAVLAAHSPASQSSAWQADPQPGDRSVQLTQEWATPPAHPGAPPTFAVTQPATDRTNVLAVVAFVLSFFFWIVAIPFGHVALSQIKRTRERGRPLALAALILSYGAILVVGVLVATLIALDSSGRSKGTAAQPAAAAARAKSGAPDPRLTAVAPTTQPVVGQPVNSQPVITRPAPPIATPTVPPAPPVSPYTFLQQLGPVDDGDCATHAGGQVQQVLAIDGCDDLTRWIDTTTASGRPVVVSVADVTLPDPTSVPGFMEMITRNGTGDVNTLIDDYDFYPGGPTTFASDPTFLAVARSSPGQVLVLEAMWRSGTTHADDPGLVPVLAGLATLLR